MGVIMMPLTRAPRRRRLLLVGAAIGVAMVVAATGPGASAAPAPGPGWTTVWTDDFAGSGPLGSDWIYRTGAQIAAGRAQVGSGEVETNTQSVAKVVRRGCGLHITALRDAAGAWTSGRVETS